MPRIIAGAAGSIALKTPPTGTRPTSDRVREAIFSGLDARDLLRGASVLDLYAGSGALGLEAVSRGAARATLVDNGAQAVRALRQNVAAVRRAVGPDALIDIAARSVHTYLASLPAGDDGPTLVFLDPPYDQGDDAVLRDLELVSAKAADGAVVVLERSSRSGLPDAWPAGLDLERSRDYGDTRVITLVSRRPAP
jgi:16S rRNA (guanine966-N2)-methyltransferase